MTAVAAHVVVGVALIALAIGSAVLLGVLDSRSRRTTAVSESVEEIVRRWPERVNEYLARQTEQQRSIIDGWRETVRLWRVELDRHASNVGPVVSRLDSIPLRQAAVLVDRIDELEALLAPPEDAGLTATNGVAHWPIERINEGWCFRWRRRANVLCYRPEQPCPGPHGEMYAASSEP